MMHTHTCTFRILLMTCLLFTAASCSSDPDEQGDTVFPMECFNGNYFTKMLSQGYTTSEYFTVPVTSHFIRIAGKKLVRTTPQNLEAEVFEAAAGIFTESVKVTAEGGIFFLDGINAYYRKPSGQIISVAAPFSIMVQGYWEGTAFLTADGNYAYFRKDGTGIAFNVLDKELQIVKSVSVPGLSYGDFQAGYMEGNMITYIQINDVWKRKYVLDATDPNAVIYNYVDLQVPGETFHHTWRNFTLNGNKASFQVYLNDPVVTGTTNVHHYIIDLDGGAYITGSVIPRNIPGPDGYYRYETQLVSGTETHFVIRKYTWNDVLLWTVKVNSGPAGFAYTMGWADATGVLLLSRYSSDPNNLVSNLMYISAEGKLCH